MFSNLAATSETLEVRGQQFTARELSVDEMTEVQRVEDPIAQARAMVALAVSNGSGEPIGDAGIGALPWRAYMELQRAAQRVNSLQPVPGEGDEKKV